MQNHLHPDSKVKINDDYFTVTEYISRGTTFITYKVEDADKSPHIFKEFFPKSIENEIERVFDEQEILIGIKPKENASADTTNQFKNKHTALENCKKTYLKILRSYELTKDEKRKYSFNNYMVKDDIKWRSDDAQVFYITDYTEAEAATNYLKKSDVLFTDKLEMLLVLSTFLNELYLAGYVCCDLKPDNFLYVSEKHGNRILSFFDYDSFIPVSGNYDLKLLSSPGYTPPEFKALINGISQASVVYMLGVILFQICFPFKYEEHIRNNRRSNDCFPVDVSIKSDMKKAFNSGKTDVDFWSEFCNLSVAFADDANETPRKISLDQTSKEWIFDILTKSVCRDEPSRYQEITAFINDIEILIKIVKGKGLHPAVFLKKIRLLQEENAFSFEPELLCEIE